MQKSVTFVYIGNNIAMKEIWKNILLMNISFKNYPGIHLTNKEKDLYNENIRPPEEEIEETLDDEKTSWGQWIGRDNVVKLTTLPHSVNRINASPVRFPMLFLKEQQQNSETSMVTKLTQNNHKVVCRENNAGNSAIPDFKLCQHKVALGAGTGESHVSIGPVLNQN